MGAQGIGHVLGEGADAAVGAQLRQRQEPEVQPERFVERRDPVQERVGIREEAGQNLCSDPRADGVGDEEGLVLHPEHDLRVGRVLGEPALEPALVLASVPPDPGVITQRGSIPDAIDQRLAGVDRELHVAHVPAHQVLRRGVRQAQHNVRLTASETRSLAVLQ